MTLNEILNANGIAEDVVKAILAAMKENKIFTASEENLDIRYGKLKTDHEGTVKELETTKGALEDMRKSTKGQEELQKKLADYDKRMEEVQQELEDAKFDAEAKLGLMTAKAVDVDYMLFKLKENLKAEGKQVKVDENGKIPGWNDLLSGLQTQSPKMFEAVEEGGDDDYQIFNPNKLKGNEGGDLTVTREKFASMGYEERMALKQKNEKLYNSMVK
jgi:hypothetical protein